MSQVGIGAGGPPITSPSWAGAGAALPLGKEGLRLFGGASAVSSAQLCP